MGHQHSGFDGLALEIPGNIARIATAPHLIPKRSGLGRTWSIELQTTHSTSDSNE